MSILYRVFGKKYKKLFAYRRRHPQDNSYNAVYLFDTLLDDSYTWQRVPGLDQRIAQ